MRLINFASLALLALAFTSCTAASEGEGEPECTSRADCSADTGLDLDQCIDGTCTACEVAFELPEPNDPCLPRCGNELGVGMPCTKDGGECNGNNIHALFCTIDQVADADLHMCTGPCVDDTDCGTNAVCQGDPADPTGPKGCVPATCAS